MMRFKISVEQSFPYKDMRVILDSLAELGYEIELVDNGNIVCELKDCDIYGGSE